MTTKELSLNKDIVEYYTETSLDYEGWSSGYNMHFGCFKCDNVRDFFKLLFSREAQLEKANQEVLSAFSIKPNKRYLDMGCGFGATARTFAGQYSQAQLDAITITPEQVAHAEEKLTDSYPHVDNVNFHCMDFQYTRFNDDSFDGVYNIESACYGKGKSKSALAKEVHRLLKPGGKWIVHDVFTVSPVETGNSVFRWAYRWLCKGWAVEDYIDKNAFKDALQEQGFCNIRFKNVFWQVLPSALHIPLVATRYLFKKIIFSQAFYQNPILRKQRWLHFTASICAPIVALHYWRFGYYVVSAEKKR